MTATRYPNGLSATNRGSAITTEINRRTRVIPISFADGTTENETGFTLPSTAIVRAVYLRVKTAEATGATKTISIGTLSTAAGDADGFLVGVSVAASGLVGPSITETTGVNETYISALTHGALLSDSELGTDVAGNTGFINSRPDISSGGKQITWTPGSVDFAELKADIIIEYDEVNAV